ncbi:dual specificity protein kinase splB-like isoform X1 [Anopheles funestus]|uniref:dual specificity protein kinase splB-like isoform X1 n=2 Tax=Anopheles funestus TaxID=62324 RepID=UPI0020C5D5E5|nr:dual specificity protein kinase splB-like isoform X1 [Anopheles funestus]
MNESSIVTERKGVEDKMDDNENYIECSKMNFSQFTNPFAGPNQFAAGKFPQNLTTTGSNGQVLGLVSGGEGAMQFLRPVDGTAVSAASAMFHQQQSQHGQIVTTAGMPHPGMASPAYITLPITMPGAKPGDAQQTVQIQVLNPNPLPSQMSASAAGQTGQTGSAQSGTLQAPKFQMGQMQIPIQGFQQGTTVLTVAYSPQDEEVLHNQGLPEGMTIVAALQPQDLQLLASQNPGSTTILQQQQSNLSSNNASSPGGVKIDSENPPPLRQIKQESPAIWNQPTLVPTSMHSTSNLIEMVQQQQQQHQIHHLHQQQQQQQQSRPPQNLNLQPYLKFNNNNNNGTNSAMTTIMNGSHVLQQLVLPSGVTIGPGIIKQEVTDEHSNENTQFGPADSTGQGENGTEGSPDARNVTGINGREHENQPGENGDGTGGNGTTPSGKVRKKRKYKTKPPKPKRQKPGQVHIATAIDGTVLFCCPECHMAYPEKECLEQHLVVHKIERRFICDICGAGLKRKEHLERHKLGHNPERPFICNVCEKGFKRKEHLNLHYVIHSGVKTEICNDCGKGFYRKDHLRKHIKSHLTKRLKEEKASNRNNNNNNNNNNNRNTTNGANTTTTTLANGTPSTSIATLPTSIPPGLTITTASGSMQSGAADNVDATVGQSAATQQNSSTQNLLQSAISLPQGVTIHVPTADNQTLPVQISLPHLVAQQQTDTDGSTRTVLVSNSPENLNHIHSTISTTTTTTSSSSSTAASTAL